MPFKMKKVVFQFRNIFTHSRVIQVFELCKLEIDDVICGYSIETNHQKRECLWKNKSGKMKLGSNIVPQKKKQGKIYSVVAMATVFAPVSFSFEVYITICDSITSKRRNCP